MMLDMKTSIPKMSTPSGRAAFSLLEVMIAIAIFFGGVFVILALVSQTLANARRLQRPMVDASMIASELTLTNKLVEGDYSGDFGKLYPGYTWTSHVEEVRTNKLFQVDYVVENSKNKTIVSQMSILLFRPESPAGSMDGGTTRR